ncbi:S26 family signal peptidase, partial [Staphylococcus epidermidis]|uniref:S26 family signal peptidase n=1 Tax=Staphylococcus epidermidis TaxID=1282 RepID=UPI001C92D45E
SKNKMIIPKDKYLVVGENRRKSIDSRYCEVGLICKKEMVGKVILRFWGFNDMKYNFNG